MRWGMFIGLAFAIPALAEPISEANQVYSASSQLRAESLNKAVEILRDPTAMSRNFRQALRALPKADAPPPSASVAVKEELDDLGLPDIELVAKVFSEYKPPSIVLKVSDKYHDFEEGEQMSQVIDNHLVTMHVQEISKHTVRLLIMPVNKILIFN